MYRLIFNAYLFIMNCSMSIINYFFIIHEPRTMHIVEKFYYIALTQCTSHIKMKTIQSVVVYLASFISKLYTFNIK